MAMGTWGVSRWGVVDLAIQQGGREQSRLGIRRCGRVAVDQDHAVPLLAQRAHRLRPRVVELRRLPITMGPLPRMRMLWRSVAWASAFVCVCVRRLRASAGPSHEGLGRRRRNAKLSVGAGIYALNSC